jgi:hypothetical protein
MTGDKPCEPFPRYYPELFGAADLQRRLIDAPLPLPALDIP